MQYGIDMVLIDNLMTSIEINVNSDLYRAQSMFVNKLCKLAKRHNIVVLLIVHPRKTQQVIWMKMMRYQDQLT